MKILTETQILKLKPEFIFGTMPMRDWFEINRGGSYYSIRSGLRHANGETKSPFHYELSLCGKDAKKKSLEEFTKWWNQLNKENETN